MKLLCRSLMLFALLLVLSDRTEAHMPPVIKIDTAGHELFVHGNKIDKTNIEQLLNAMDHHYRKVVKGNKTLHISDGAGFVVEETENSVAIMIFFKGGSKEDEPKSAFTGKLFINLKEITTASKIDEIRKELPKTEKVLAMPDALLYMSSKLTLSAKISDGALTECNFGFKTK